jgi:hypothetical protein
MRKEREERGREMSQTERERDKFDCQSRSDRKGGKHHAGERREEERRMFNPLYLDQEGKEEGIWQKMAKEVHKCSPERG